MEPFGFDQLPEVLRQLFEKVEHIEILVLDLRPECDEQPKMMDIKEAAKFLNITVAALYTLVSRKEVPVNKPGKRLYFDKTELVEWIRSGKKKTINDIKQTAPSRFAARRNKIRP